MYVGFIGLFVCLFVLLCLVVIFKSLHLFLKSICQSLICFHYVSLGKSLLTVVMPFWYALAVHVYQVNLVKSWGDQTSLRSSKCAKKGMIKYNSTYKLVHIKSAA